MSEMKITEEQMVALTRNALLVAGHEMGKTGDHWPVINSTIYDFMKDWENLKIERNVHAELRAYIYAYLDELGRILTTCSKEAQIESAPQLKMLREIYDAYFDAVDIRNFSLDEDKIPMHLKRAEAIIETLEDSA